MLSDVVVAGRRAEEQIRRNRELFGLGVVQKELIDIGTLVQDVATLCGAQFEGSQISLTISLASGLPAVAGDRLELQQVLLNLVLNSMESTESLSPEQRRIEISASVTPEGAVKVSVRDNGVGLKDVDMRRLFASETGMGLSHGRSVIQAHGGRLWAEQNADCGATFSFTIPVQAWAADPTQAAHAVGTSSAAPPTTLAN
jgi:two-component system sensor kinase FixL